MTDPSQLSPQFRSQSIDAMRSQAFDVVVIGGGVTGCGAALDAASRGLSVALIEQRDYAAGTSSRSSKMFHGGLRYLEQFRFGLVREALRERNLMVETLCPYLTEPVRFMYPLRHRVWERIYVGAGVLLYDLFAAVSANPLPWHRHHSRRGALRIAPALRGDALKGAVSYFDVVVDDARHTAALARTAAAHGASMATSVRAVGLIQDGERVTGVRAHDLERGEEFSIESSVVLNTTGVWTDSVESWAGDDRTHVMASKGIHLVVPKEAIDLDGGLILRTNESVLFVIPWHRHWIIGTTDTEWDLHLAHPAASRNDIEYLLRQVNSMLERELTHDDIVGVYAGLRPLLRGESDATSKLSREHSVRSVSPGLISVAGGKYTTYRVMAADAIDAVSSQINRSVPESTTNRIPLVGTGEVAKPAGGELAPGSIQRLERRYGSNIGELMRLIDEDPSLGSFVSGAEPYLRAEVVYAVTHEGALHLDDVLTRRTRISIETSHRGIESATDTAVLMAPLLGWKGEDTAREIEHYLARVSAERDSQTKADDSTADAARMGAADVRMTPGRGRPG